MPDTAPWCPMCEWNLDVHERALAPWRGTTLLGRWGFRRGVALDRRIRAGLLADPDAPPPATTRGETWLLVVSAVVVLLGVAALAYLGWLVAGSDLPPGVRLVLALPAIALLVVVLPYPGSVPDDLVVTEVEAPTLHAVVRDLAAAAGAPAPEIVAIDHDLNASVGRAGWRQRSVLVIGMPLWVTLTREERLSLLAHEVGHLANGDPLRMTRTLPARTFGARAVAATGGRNPWSRALVGGVSAAQEGVGVVGLVVHGALAVVNVTGATIQLLVDSVAMPDSRSAEYRADLTARRVAGSAPFVDSSAGLLVAPAVMEDLWHVAPRIDGDGLEHAAAVARERLAGKVGFERQLSRRRTDLWSTHPSDDGRMALVEALPAVEASFVVDDDRWARIDAELAAWRRRFHRALLGTRDRF